MYVQIETVKFMKKIPFLLCIIFLNSIFLPGQTKNWKYITPPGNGTYNLVKINQKTGELFAGGVNGFYKTKDSGKTWVDVYGSGLPTPKKDVQSFDFDTSGNIYLSLNGSNSFFKSIDKGLTYKNIVTSPLCYSPRVIGINPMDNKLFLGMWVSLPCNYLLCSMDGGSSYYFSLQKKVSSYGPEFGNKFTFNGNTIYLADLDSSKTQPTFYRSSDNGNSWYSPSNGLPNPIEPLSAIVVNNSGAIFVGFKNKGVYKSTDNCNSWKECNDSLLNKCVDDLIAAPNGDIYAATKYGVHILKNNTTHWQQYIDNNNLFYSREAKSLAFSQDNNTLYAAGGNVCMTEDAKYIDVLAPTSKDTLFINDNYTIRWKSFGNSGKVKIILYNMDESIVKNISDSTDDTGEYTWSTINATPLKYYFIGIKGLIDYSIKGFSDSFSISNKIYPALGINFNPGSDGFYFPDDQQSMWPQNWWESNCSQQPYNDVLFKALAGYSSNQYPNCSLYPDWDLYARASGGDAYLLGSFNPNAVLKWRGITGSWTGSAFGMAGTSLLYYCNLLKKPTGIYSTNDITISDSIRNVINLNNLMQFTDYYNFNKLNIKTVSISQTLDSIKSSFSKDKKKNIHLSYFVKQSNGTYFSNTIVPYRLIKVYNSKTSNYVDSIYFYDVRYPSRKQIILIDESLNTWVNLLHPNEKGTNLLIPEPDISNFTSLENINGYNEVYFNDSSLVELVNTKYQKISNIDIDSSTIDGGKFILPSTGGMTSIKGFYLPGISNNELTINQKQQNDKNNYLTVISDGFSFNSNINSSTLNNSINYYANLANDSLWLNNAEKCDNFNISFVYENQRAFHILKSSLNANDTISFKIMYSGGEFIIRNMGTSKSYDLFLKNFDLTLDTIRFKNLILNSDETHLVTIKNWGNIHKDSIVLKRYKGTDLNEANHIIDTCLNCLMSDVGSNKKNIINNFQIVPNPATDNISINYYLTEPAKVSFTIMNSLGIPIAESLATEISDLNENVINFDTKDLPSGIYYVQIVAGNQIITKKYAIIR